MLVVADDPALIEAQLRAGALLCEGCSGELRPWGWASVRWVRTLSGPIRIRPRRTCCRSCRSTHVLLPSSVLLRRLDAAEVIGQALAAKASGRGRRTISAELGVAASTVRNWLRRAETNAEFIRGQANYEAIQLGADAKQLLPRGSPTADALHALGVAATAAAHRLGAPACPWHLLASLTGGRLLSPRPT